MRTRLISNKYLLFSFHQFPRLMLTSFIHRSLKVFLNHTLSWLRYLLSSLNSYLIISLIIFMAVHFNFIQFVSCCRQTADSNRKKVKWRHNLGNGRSTTGYNWFTDIFFFFFSGVTVSVSIYSGKLKSCLILYEHTNTQKPKMLHFYFLLYERGTTSIMFRAGSNSFCIILYIFIRVKFSQAEMKEYIYLEIR